MCNMVTRYFYWVHLLGVPTFTVLTPVSHQRVALGQRFSCQGSNPPSVGYSFQRQAT